MKKTALLAALCALSPIAAFAHGSLVHQAAEAIDKSGQIFAQTQPKETQRLVKSVSAVLTGREQFTVAISLSTNAQLFYTCRENEEVDPVVWECVAK